MINKLTIYILLLAAVLLIRVHYSWAQEFSREYGTETIYEDTTWSGDILINGVLTIKENVTLKILPGTRVMFRKTDSNGDGFGDNEIYVQGKIIAAGTKEAPIMFTSAEDTKNPGDWIAINMMVSEDNKNLFSNCILEYSYRGFHAHFSSMELDSCELRGNFLAVQFQDTVVSIKNCMIHDNNQAIQCRDSKLNMENTKLINNNIGIRAVYGELVFFQNEILNCNMTAFQLRGSKAEIKKSTIANSKAGITAQDSDIKIDDSMILNNFEDGVALHNSKVIITWCRIMLNGDDGILLDATDAVINNNSIYNNAKYNVSLDSPDNVDAKYNYWGASDLETVQYFIRDRNDIDTLGEVDVDGFLKTEGRIEKQ